MSLSPPSIAAYNNAAAVMGYQAQQNPQQSETPPFNPQETLHEITCQGQTVIPNIEAKIGKGFFYSSDKTWTCYRRNYFSVECSYSLNPHIANGQLYLKRGSKQGQEQIQALAMSLSAVVDGTAGKSIELVQHTPKRDKGPQLQIQKEKLAPTPPRKSQTDAHGYPVNTLHAQATMTPPYLPLQNAPEQSQADPEQHQAYSPAGASSSTYSHTFERIQFKSATANNGKRRAQQQYYHLIVELYADVRSRRESKPDWVKLAQRISAAVVVRGRSPSHYQNEGPHSASSSRGPGGPGSTSGGGNPGYGATGAPGLGARGLDSGLAGLGGSMGGGMYRGSQYSLDPSPMSSYSVSSASSVSGGAPDGLVNNDAMMDENESKAIEGFDGYQYYPSTLYEAGLPPGAKTLGPAFGEQTRVKTEYGGHVQLPPAWQVGGCGRFQGTETSRGYYPDLHTGC
ncbi:hypothetical protein H2201_000214 [Coniosporium apollinis]|uniref:NDT80 domain-containing protein n=1 Tax=Coniosporium apollinis TaxID=61459 RepID=A0ABQ9P6X7_9PEZI|nr:hypothetical protein H2201_000214 [Coniosporium apollinis]